MIGMLQSRGILGIRISKRSLTTDLQLFPVISNACDINVTIFFGSISTYGTFNDQVADSQPKMCT